MKDLKEGQTKVGETHTSMELLSAGSMANGSVDRCGSGVLPGTVGIAGRRTRTIT